MVVNRGVGASIAALWRCTVLLCDGSLVFVTSSILTAKPNIAYLAAPRRHEELSSV